MVSRSINDQLSDELKRLPPDKQQRVLEFVRTLSTDDPRLMPGSKWLTLGGIIPPDDLTQMQRVIDAECRQVNPDDWK